jgi:hypothetical protein
VDVSLMVRISFKHHDGKRFVDIDAYVTEETKCSAPEVVFSGPIETAHVSEFVSTQQFVTKCLFDALIAMNDEADQDGYLPVPQLMLDASEHNKD